MRDKSKLMSEPGEMILEVRFVGESLALHGIPIYELGTALVSIQRMVNKAHLAREHRWKHGSFPARGEREMLALQIGARRRGSDWFGLVPLFADPTAHAAIKRAVDYVMSGLTSYALGTVLDKARSESDETRRLVIGAIHAETVNIVNRIGNVGGCERIEISFPDPSVPQVVTFDENSRDYVRTLEKSPYLGATQTIEGDVFRLDPSRDIVEIWTPQGRRCKVFLKRSDFDLVRYGQTHGTRIEVTGKPRLRFGAEKQTFNEFEGTAVVLLDEEARDLQ